ncbi:MAG TPA: hypothetical protein VGV37_03475 [Aliidongia sp.]|uniref:hypothetical protein n=1 Tax=Aliidongia sp. TaxID=1914230 RepID=UPI002DDD85EF|nr:hypothetical protein [Aliidongia sp.]HEV2673575.1 hypothetical protein [Aliidongia sp.]
MNDDAPFQPDRALFERWRSHESVAADPPAELDPMLLAAYLDGRLDEPGSAPLERLLQADPAALDDLIDCRTHPVGPEIASAAFLRNAQALIPSDHAASTATVLPFQPRPAAPRRMTAWAAWGAVAASLILISLVGFNVGMQTERNINGATGIGTSIDILDQSTTLLGDGVG